VQVIQEVAKTAAALTVWKRQPNWCAPVLNRPITPDEQQRIKAGYSEMFARCNDTVADFLHRPIGASHARDRPLQQTAPRAMLGPRQAPDAPARRVRGSGPAAHVKRISNLISWRKFCEDTPATLARCTWGES